MQQAPTSQTDSFDKNSVANVRHTPSRSNLSYEPKRQAVPMSPTVSMRSLAVSQHTMGSSTPNLLPSRSHSVASARPLSTLSKRHGTMHHEFSRRHEVPQTVHGGHRYKGTYRGAPIVEDEFDVVNRDDGADFDVSFEGLDNVRGEKLRTEFGDHEADACIACCDGAHVVGSHHHHKVKGNTLRTPTRAPAQSLRAWSTRSRRSSNVSTGRQHVGSIFGRGPAADDNGSLHSTATAKRADSAVGRRSIPGSPTPTPRKAT